MPDTAWVCNIRYGCRTSQDLAVGNTCRLQMLQGMLIQWKIHSYGWDTYSQGQVGAPPELRWAFCARYLDEAVKSIPAIQHEGSDTHPPHVTYLVATSCRAKKRAACGSHWQHN